MNDKVYIVIHLACLRNGDFGVHGAYLDKERAQTRMKKVVDEQRRQPLTGQHEQSWIYCIKMISGTQQLVRRYSSKRQRLMR